MEDTYVIPIYSNPPIIPFTDRSDSFLVITYMYSSSPALTVNLFLIV